jgi:hypothetical protein
LRRSTETTLRDQSTTVATKATPIAVGEAQFQWNKTRVSVI